MLSHKALQRASKREQEFTPIAELVRAGWAGSAVAQTAPSGATKPTASKADNGIDYRISAQPFANGLRQFAKMTGLPLIYDAKIAEGKKLGEVSGSMNANAALTRMLAGSGLAFMLSANGSVLLSTGASSGTPALGVVRVDGGNLDGGKATVANGVNGSTDVQATEGAGSYATSTATKSVQTLKDTPFAVSVIRRQRLDDRGSLDLNGATDKMTGLTTIFGSHNQQRTFISRGFISNSLSVDGSAPFTVDNGTKNQDYTGVSYQPLINLSAYDSVQPERKRSEPLL